jgi:hypothetical protein
MVACTSSTTLITSLDVVAGVIDAATAAEPLLCGSVIPVPLCPVVESATAGAAALVQTISMQLASSATNGAKAGTISGAIATFVGSLDASVRPYVSAIVTALQAFALQVNPPVVAVKDRALKAVVDTQVVKPNILQRHHLNKINSRMDKDIATIKGRKK